MPASTTTIVEMSVSRFPTCESSCASTPSSSASRFSTADSAGAGFELAFIDEHMPGMNGLETVQGIGKLALNEPERGRRALGLRLPRAMVPATTWGPWQVVARANGFHVSRESANDQRTEAHLNAVGRTMIFRRRELADAACAKLNAEAAS